jgi:tetratricopeptide (TPR) repeat protein
VRCSSWAASLALAAVTLPAPSRAQEKAERPAEARPPGRATYALAPTTFVGLFAAYVKADRAGDAEGARRAFQELRRLRIERNVPSLDEIALALVAQGKQKLDRGDRDGAAELFATASNLAPTLPDAHLALALAQWKRGPLGFVPAVRSTIEGYLALVPTARGQYHGVALLVPVALLALFVAMAVFATCMLMRLGPLLRHDLEEALGSGRSRSVALAIHLLLLLLPIATFQGWAWLFPWWLALLLVYMNLREKLASVLFLLAMLAVGPALNLLDDWMEAARNPLFWASVAAVEGTADTRSLAELERAAKVAPGDRDLSYLLASQLRRAGRYEDAAAIYREVLRTSPDDVVARNNLANLEFARGEFQSALVRYKEGAAKASDSDAKAVFYYNQSLAHLQKFEMQPADEALSQARRLSGGLISTYDRLWKYDKGDYAVVDMGLSTEDVEEKFLGVAQGPGRKNVFGSPSKVAESPLTAMLNRFAGFLAVATLGVVGLSFWRGRRTFTMRCLKCGTPFCRRCHLGAAVAGLCSQCYHLFVVRDGVSGPARNRKLLEVQAEEGRQDRHFRLLSMLAPGAGQIYRGAPFLGLALSLAWALVIAFTLLAGRVLPVTEVPRALSGPPLSLGVAGVLLAAIYFFAHRAKPDAELLMPVRRAGAGRGRGRA